MHRAVGSKDKLIRVCRQKVNSQGDDETKYGQQSVCKRNILQTACENFTTFTGSVQLETNMNLLDFEVKSHKEKGHSETINGQMP